MKPLLWIGSDRHALNACIRNGIDVILIQGASGHDFGYDIPDGLRGRILVDDQRNLECLTAAVVRAGLADGIRAVGTNDERCLLVAGALARSLGCPGPDPMTVIRFRDKAIQKTAVARAGVPVADFTVVPDIRELPEPLEVPGWPLVAKPIAGAGTSMTHVLPDAAALRKLSADCRARKFGSRTFLLEKYVPGEELQVDGVVSGGRLQFLCVGTYGQPCIEAIADNVPVRMVKADPTEDADVYAAVTPVVTTALAALGLTDSVFHMELFRDFTTGELTFGECAARRGGGLIQEEIRFKFGIDLAEAAVLMSVDGAWEGRPQVRPDYVGSTFLPIHPGTLLRCPSADEIMRQPGVAYARLEVPLGFTMSGQAGDTVVKIGQALLSAPTPKELNERMDALLTWFDAGLEVVPPNLTGAELRRLPFFAEFRAEAGSFAE